MKILKKWVTNFLKDIEKANEKAYGYKKLDCCGLNSNQHKNSANCSKQK